MLDNSLCYHRTCIFAYGIIEDLVRQWRRKKDNQNAVESVIPPVSIATASRPAATKPVFRGYDSPELFKEDSVIRIRELEREIASDLEEMEKGRSK